MSVNKTHERTEDLNPNRSLLKAALAISCLATILVPSAAYAQQESIESDYRWIDRSMRAGLFA